VISLHDGVVRWKHGPLEQVSIREKLNGLAPGSMQTDLVMRLHRLADSLHVDEVESDASSNVIRLQSKRR